MSGNPRQAGYTLMEMVVAVALSTVLLGAVFAVQQTAAESFTGSLAENKMTKQARDGIDDLKRELRSCLSSSITWNAWPNDPLVPLIRFRQAVSFDSVNGLAVWGADAEVGGWVEYVVVGTDLIRRIRNGANAIVSEEKIIGDIDLNPDFGMDPVELAWDDTTNLVRVVIRREITVNGRPTKRNLDTMVFVDPVFEF